MPKKRVWVIAGANGAGKSTFYRLFLSSSGLPFVNPDEIASAIAPEDPAQAAYEASRLASQLREHFMRAGLSFCTETVFSHESKVDFVAEAKSLGYEVGLVFIHLDNPEMNQARVAQRQREGGHSVPLDKIVSRIPRTLRNIRAAVAIADIVQLYDNTSEANPFVNVANIHDGVVEQMTQDLPQWARDLIGAGA